MSMSSVLTPYHSDVSNEEWPYATPTCAVTPEGISQHTYALADDVFNSRATWCVAALHDNDLR